MFRELGVAGLIAGTAMVLSVVPVQADDGDAQERNQKNSVSESVSYSVEANEKQDRAVTTGAYERSGR